MVRDGSRATRTQEQSVKSVKRSENKKEQRLNKGDQAEATRNSTQMPMSFHRNRKPIATMENPRSISNL